MPYFGTEAKRAIRKKSKAQKHIQNNSLLRFGFFSKKHARWWSRVLDFFRDWRIRVEILNISDELYSWAEFDFLDSFRCWSIYRQQVKSFFYWFMFVKFKLMTFWDETHASILFIHFRASWDGTRLSCDNVAHIVERSGKDKREVVPRSPDWLYPLQSRWRLSVYPACHEANSFHPIKLTFIFGPRDPDSGFQRSSLDCPGTGIYGRPLSKDPWCVDVQKTNLMPWS